MIVRADDRQVLVRADDRQVSGVIAKSQFPVPDRLQSVLGAAAKSQRGPGWPGGYRGPARAEGQVGSFWGAVAAVPDCALHPAVWLIFHYVIEETGREVHDYHIQDLNIGVLGQVNP